MRLRFGLRKPMVQQISRRVQLWELAAARVSGCPFGAFSLEDGRHAQWVNRIVGL
jgi:hypothetical protein